MQKVTIAVANCFSINKSNKKMSLKMMIDAEKDGEVWFKGCDDHTWDTDDVETVKSIEDCWISCANKYEIIHSFLDGYTQQLNKYILDAYKQQLREFVAVDLEFSVVDLKLLLVELYKKGILSATSQEAVGLKVAFKIESIESNDVEINLEINTTLTKE